MNRSLRKYMPVLDTLIVGHSINVIVVFSGASFKYRQQTGSIYVFRWISTRQFQNGWKEIGKADEGSCPAWIYPARPADKEWYIQARIINREFAPEDTMV